MLQEENTKTSLDEISLGGVVAGVAKYAIRKSVYGRPVTVNNTTPEANNNASPQQNSQNDYVNNLKKTNEVEMNTLKNKNKPTSPVVESLCYNGFSLLEQFLEDVDVNIMFKTNTESPSYTDYAITAIVLEHISQNYKTTTLDETAWQIVNNIEINENLYRELYESLLDETIGSAIARVYNAPNNLSNSFQKTMAQRAANNANNRANTSTLKAGNAQINAVNIRNDHETAKTNGTYGNGVKGFFNKTGGAIKSGYAELQAKNATNKANNDQENANYTNRNLRTVNQQQQTSDKNTNRLGHKIDNLVRDPVSALAQGTLYLAKNLVKNAWASR